MFKEMKMSYQGCERIDEIRVWTPSRDDKFIENIFNSIRYSSDEVCGFSDYIERRNNVASIDILNIIKVQDGDFRVVFTWTLYSDLDEKENEKNCYIKD